MYDSIQHYYTTTLTVRTSQELGGSVFYTIIVLFTYVPTSCHSQLQPFSSDRTKRAGSGGHARPSGVRG